jgi:hypothetical protein
MKEKLNEHQRFVVCISDEQKRRIEDWVEKNQVSLTEFGRAALSAHVKNMKKLEQQRRLADTCKLFSAELTGI